MPKVFLPVIRNGIGEDDDDKLFRLIRDSSYQERAQMKRHPLLDLAAQLRANDMAEKDYFGHVSPTGETANRVARAVGYKLPDSYENDRNNIESLSIGGGDPQAVAQGWYESRKGHRFHVYGIDKFYREQECVGIGRARAKDNRIISVFLSAPCS